LSYRYKTEAEFLTRDQIKPEVINQSGEDLRTRDLQPIIQQVLIDPQSFKVYTFVDHRGCKPKGATWNYNHRLKGVPCPYNNINRFCYLGLACPLVHDTSQTRVTEKEPISSSGHQEGGFAATKCLFAEFDDTNHARTGVDPKCPQHQQPANIKPFMSLNSAPMQLQQQQQPKQRPQQQSSSHSAPANTPEGSKSRVPQYGQRENQQVIEQAMMGPPLGSSDGFGNPSNGGLNGGFSIMGAADRPRVPSSHIHKQQLNEQRQA
jgi:hypothetical protein